MRIGFIRMPLAAVLLLIGVATGPIFARDKTQTYPLLKDQPSSNSFELHFIADTYMTDITYSPAGNFFLLDAGPVYKINAGGVEEFSIKMKEDYLHLPSTPYVATPKGIYDLSQKRPRFQRFLQVVNGSRTLSLASFTRQYSQAYKDADVVVYGNLRGDISRYSAFLQIRGKWSHFYLSYDAVDLVDDYELGVTVKNYLAKYDRMVLLKDPKTNIYASGSPRVRRDGVKVPEDRLKYATQGRLKLMRFDNLGVSGTVANTSITREYGGMAYHRLSYGGEMIYFRERARKPVLRRVMTQLNWFVLPAPYQKKTPVGFLEFRPNSNMDTAGSDGIYVLRRK